MRNIKLTVAYDGTDFCGWQFQPGVRTVQGELTEAVRMLVNDEIVLTAASRTDSGVHALGQTVNFVSGTDIGLDHILRGINSRTPADVAVTNAEDVPEGFHSTFNAVGKHYRYTIWLDQADNPLTRRYHWWYPKPLDLEAMRLATEQMTGTVEFRGLQVRSGKTDEKTLRTVTDIKMTVNSYECVIDIFGKGFMYKQVRSMVGLIVTAGRGRIGVEEIPDLLAGDPLQRRSEVAPPQGLALMRVYY